MTVTSIEQQLARLEQIKATLNGAPETQAQTAVAVAEPEAPKAVTVAAEPETSESGDQRLTDKEAITIVQRWVTQDADLELSERRTFEEMVSDLRDAAEYRGSTVPVSKFEEIVKTYAPDAPQRKDIPEPKTNKLPSHPAELASLIKSGVAYSEYDHWFLKRCRTCGNFKTKCCGLIDDVSAFRDDDKTLTAYGRQALGLDPIKTPAPPKIVEQTAETWAKQSWWHQFRGAGELEGNGTLRMYIENVIPEGICLICGLPKEGKSFFGLACAKALTTGNPLFGRRGFEVPEIVPVLYLAAESGDGALKLRCDKFGITNDKSKFIARTLSQGPMFGLDDPNIESLVRTIRPIIILESLVRFNNGKDEDDATENRKLAEMLFRLIAWGAKAVIGLHHSRKDLNKGKPTKESAVRGSGDGLAMVDVVWLVMQDERLYQRGSGPNEIDVVGWGRDFNPTPMRLALTKKAPKGTPAEKLFAPGIVSVIDSTGDLGWIERRIVFDIQDQDIERLIAENPSVTIKEIIKLTNGKEWEIRKIIKRLGYHRTQGGKKGSTKWEKNGSEPSTRPRQEQTS
jgi:hypothetical protein